ncbi:hypothetical protein V1279_004591 [Bradyrhizobium sp. AZCC 1610]
MAAREVAHVEYGNRDLHGVGTPGARTRLDRLRTIAGRMKYAANRLFAARAANERRMLL